VCLEYIEASLEPSFQRIVILDGPSVLSRPRLDALQANVGALPLGEGVLRMCIQEAMDSGIIGREPAWALGYIVSGALENVTRVIAMSAENLKAPNRKILTTALVRFLDRMRINQVTGRKAKGIARRHRS
jgi:hypothetical protein